MNSLNSNPIPPPAPSVPYPVGSTNFSNYHHYHPSSSGPHSNVPSHHLHSSYSNPYYHKRGCRGGKRILPLIIVGGATLYVYTSLKRELEDIKDEVVVSREIIGNLGGGGGIDSGSTISNSIGIDKERSKKRWGWRREGKEREISHHPQQFIPFQQHQQQQQNEDRRI